MLLSDAFVFHGGALDAGVDDRASSIRKRCAARWLATQRHRSIPSRPSWIFQTRGTRYGLRAELTSGILFRVEGPLK